MYDQAKHTNYFQMTCIVYGALGMPLEIFKSIAGKKNKMQVFTHELVNDLGKETKEMIFTRELLDKLG